MKSEVLHQPVADKMTRERTFKIEGTREDGKDKLAQLVITIQQILAENPKFTGQICINCNEGGIGSIQTKESARVSA